MATTTDKAVVGAAAVAVTGAVLAASGAFSPQAGATADMSDAEIARFLTQCTFGPSDAAIAQVRAAGSLSAWIDQQMAMPAFSMLNFVRTAQQPFNVEGAQEFLEAFWTRVITGPDQLRQRMQFALSQHFVVSLENGTLRYETPRGTTAFYDLLAANAFGNFRDLLGKVTFNPIMGVFLSYVMNEKEDPSKGRSPDENFARESMQLFMLGTYLLNDDGTPQLSGGKTIPTYTHDDIVGLARVFTGMSWFSTGLEDQAFLSSAYSFFDQGGQNGNPTQMAVYPKHHSVSEKKFLGVTIPATPKALTNSKADVATVTAEINLALDTLFKHPNCPPFVCTRLIKRFITSNPSPAYVGRVTAVFKNNGQGVRGDLTAVLKAILLDDEARNMTAAQANPVAGKLREPVLRLSNWTRAFEVTSKNGFYDINETGDPSDLSQSVLDAPSVFNFWRDTYVAPQSHMGALPNPLNPTIPGLTVPEFQVVNELTTASYLNFMNSAIGSGAGHDEKTQRGADVISTYAKETALIGPKAKPTDAGALVDVDKLLDRLNLLLFYGQMSPALRQQIKPAVAGVKVTIKDKKNPAPVDTDFAAARLNQVKLATFLSFASTDYLILR